MLVVLITPPPIDEEGRMQYAKYGTLFSLVLLILFGAVSNSWNIFLNLLNKHLEVNMDFHYRHY